MKSIALHVLVAATALGLGLSDVVAQPRVVQDSHARASQARGEGDAPRRESPIVLTIGRAHVLNTGAVRRLAVGNGKILQATALDSRQVLLLPEAVGQSSLHVWPQRGPVRKYLITVHGDAAARQFMAVSQMLGDSANLSARLAGDSVIIDGHDLAPSQLARVQAITRRFPDVLDLATGAASDRMISMDVKFVEIKKSVLRRLGVRWSGSANGPSFGIVGDITRSDALAREGLAALIGQRAGDIVNPFASTLSLASSIRSVLDFLVQTGDATVLAEPRLSCRSGGSAKFIAGGELPIPMSAGLGTVSVSFKEYGIKFDFEPTAMPDGRIASRIATEVSSVDFEVQVKDVPGIVKRRAETEVQLRENQTMVIAGLLSEESTRHVDKVAGLGDIPILGRLFRSTQYRSRETDLAVFVTPRFVDSEPRVVDEYQAPSRDRAPVQSAGVLGDASRFQRVGSASLTSISARSEQAGVDGAHSEDTGSGDADPRADQASPWSRVDATPPAIPNLTAAPVQQRRVGGALKRSVPKAGTVPPIQPVPKALLKPGNKLGRLRWLE